MRDVASVDTDDEEEGGEVLYLKDGVPLRSINAVLPIGKLIVIVAAGIYVAAEGGSVRAICRRQHRAGLGGARIGGAGGGPVHRTRHRVGEGNLGRPVRGPRIRPFRDGCLSAE